MNAYTAGLAMQSHTLARHISLTHPWTLFHSERILCNIVFSLSEKIVESCLTEISRDAALKLFSFPHNFGKSKKKIIIFSYEFLLLVWSEAVAALLKLNEAVRTLLSQFEAAIQKDPLKTLTNSGVHSHSHYLMNFLIFLTDYNGPISDIVAD